jgi:branched-chain amino acid transport system substrate-binding protein
MTAFLGRFFLASGLLFCLCRPASAQPDIVLGMSAAFSGPARALGIELYRGAMTYFGHVNENGGVHGRRIAIAAYDDGYNPDPAVDNALRLIDRDNVLALFQFVGTPTGTRVLPLLKRYDRENVMLLFPLTGAQLFREHPNNRNVYLLRASYLQETEQIVKHLVGMGRKRIAVFYQADAYGRSGWVGVRKALSAHGLDIVGEASHRRGAEYGQSMSEQVLILRQSEPDAVVSVGTYAACSAFVRDARDQGWDVPIAQLSFVNPDLQLMLLNEQGAHSKGDYTRGLIFSSVIPSYEDLEIPAVREYRELSDRTAVPLPEHFDLKGYTPFRYSFVGFEGFLNAKLLVEILRRMEPGGERKGLKKAIETIEGIDLGIYSKIAFNPTDNQGLDDVHFNTVVDGRLVPLTDWSALAK